MAERLTADICADLRATGLTWAAEAADKLDGLLACLVSAECERDGVRKELARMASDLDDRDATIARQRAELERYQPDVRTAMGIDERVYREAWYRACEAQADRAIDLPDDEREGIADMAMSKAHRAAVESAYRAGWKASRETAADELDLAARLMRSDDFRAGRVSIEYINGWEAAATRLELETADG